MPCDSEEIELTEEEGDTLQRGVLAATYMVQGNADRPVCPCQTCQDLMAMANTILLLVSEEMKELARSELESIRQQSHGLGESLH